jgi:iron complex outermembrane receptor protein
MRRLALLLFAFPPEAALAQDGDIIVTALPPPPSSTGYGTQQIARDAMVDTASGRLEEALARVPGFQQFRRADSRSANASAQGVSLRGIGGNAASRTLLLLDGVPQADAFFGFIPFTQIPAGDLAAARVTRGSGTGPFGAGAVAGTIELFSLAPDAQPRLSLTTAGGSHDAGELALAAAVPLGTGHVALSLHHEQGDGFWTTPVEQRVAASVPAAYRGDHAALSAAVPLGEGAMLYPRIAAFRDRRTLRFAGADNGAEGVDASLRLIARGRWQAEALGWVQMRDFSSVVVSATSFRPTLNQRATPSTGWGGKLELRAPGPASRLLRFGVDVRGADGQAVEDVLAASGARTVMRRSGGNSLIVGGFAEGDVTLGSLLLSAGARVDRWRLGGGFAQEAAADGAVRAASAYATRDGTEQSLRGAAALRLHSGLLLRAAGYTGFRLPTLNELYRGFTVFPVTTRANPALRPEHLRGWEAGAEWTATPGITISLTRFDNDLRDAIANVTIATNLRERRNIAAIRARGMELTVAAQRGPWRLDAGWSWQDSRMAADIGDAAALPLDGLRPAQTPRQAGGATLGWRRGGWRAQAGVRHVARQYEDDRNADALPAATTIDALLRAPLWRGLRLELRGENLANARVVTRNSGGTIDLGAPRTLWLGLRWAAD